MTRTDNDPVAVRLVAECLSGVREGAMLVAMPRTLALEPYVAQLARWPVTGHHILAHYDAASVVVYQAYRPNIGHFAATHGYFGGPFRLDRTSWIKTNFLWMMARNHWGQRPRMDVTLAVHLKRTAFEAILGQAVPTQYDPTVYATQEEWGAALRHAAVQVQWDPDHAPSGHPVPRRAIQLGLRGSALAQYQQERVAEIEDISPFVAAQRDNARAADYTDLLIPREEIYPVADPATARQIALDDPGAWTPQARDG